MDNGSNHPAPSAEGGQRLAAPRGLSLVRTPLHLACEAAPMPLSWSTALAQVLDWLAIETAFVPAPDRTAPVFAPWEAWSPAGFQHGGSASLPDAQFVASYCLDHGRHGSGPVDVMLISPHPAAYEAGERAAAALPATGSLRAMIRAAVSEERARIAIIGHAFHRDALARLRLAWDRALCPEGTAIDILAIEEALPFLMKPAAPWDAVIAMPDLRGIVFTLLAETSGVRGPWPMLWHKRGLRRVTCEVRGEGSVRQPFDAPALVQTLALTLHAAGRTRAAQRLHEAWAQLRESGVTTPSRGSAAPYATELPDAELIGLLCTRDAAPGRTPGGWVALKKQPMLNFGSQIASLRVIPSKIANC